MNKQEHIKRHKELHRSLDELTADFINHTGKVPSESSIYDLMVWSHQQTINPTEGKSDLDDNPENPVNSKSA